MNPDVAEEVLARGLTLSGSIITVDADSRLEAARQLVDVGAMIHADVFGVGYDLMDGAETALIAELSRAWPTHLDIHVMAENATRVVDELPLDRRIARVSVHVRPGDDLAALRSVDRARANESWISVDAHEWDPDSLRDALALLAPDGVLQMLAPAGVPGTTADLERVELPSWAAARAHGPLGVDGGVTPSAIDRLAFAGVSYVVIGRALLGSDARGHSPE